VFIAFSVILVVWTVFAIVAESGCFVSKTSWSSDCPSLIGVYTHNGYYDISLSFSSANYSRELQNIIINPRDEGSIAGLTGTINGTSVHGANPVFSCLIERGNSLSVHVLFPCARFNPGAVIELQVLGGGFMSGGTIQLPEKVVPDSMKMFIQ
jgi:hypothetical protein